MKNFLHFTSLLIFLLMISCQTEENTINNQLSREELFFKQEDNNLTSKNEVRNIIDFLKAENEEKQFLDKISD